MSFWGGIRIRFAMMYFSFGGLLEHSIRRNTFLQRIKDSALIEILLRLIVVGELKGPPLWHILVHESDAKNAFLAW